MATKLLFSWAAVLVAACGGRVDPIPSDDAGSASFADSSANPFAQETALGNCNPGFAVGSSGPDRPPCLWLAKELCYPTKEAACACICPRDHDSLCISSSSLPDGHTPVRVSCI